MSSAAASSSSSSSLHALTSTTASSALFFDQTLFSQLGLDTRLWKSLAHAHMSRLTLVQSAAIPRILEGNNCLVQAKTGTGKTLAYAVPIVQQILLEQTSDPPCPTRLSRIVLVPSIELCAQVRQAFQSLLKYCDDSVRVCALKSEQVDATVIRDNPDIIVATPAQLLNYCENSAELSRKKSSSGYLSDLPSCLKHLVIDEADLVLGQGYEEDLTALLNNSKFLGKGFQISLFSATLDEQIEELKNLYMPPPVVTIKIKDPIGSSLGKAKLTQLYYEVNSRQDKFFMTVCLLQTGLISASSKLLIFVNNIPDAYKLKLFLEQYSINSAVLNHELPRNSRMSILDHFNRGVIDILIATDEATGEKEMIEEEDEDEQVKQEEEQGGASKKNKKRTQDGQMKDEPITASSNPYAPQVEITVEETLTKKRKKDTKEEDEDEDMEEDEEEAEAEKAKAKKKGGAVAEEEEDVDVALARLNKLNKKNREKKRKLRKREAAAGAHAGSSNVSRGVDFKDVATVLNFDFPTSLSNYTHRCGRTARANASGVALSFVESEEREMLEMVLYTQFEKRNGMALESAPGDLQPLPFSPADLDAFRYRVNDVIRRVTKVAVREARLKEIKMELLNSERLKSHFEDNPRELALLKHDQVLRSKGIQKHLSTVPSYLLPEYMQQAAAAAASAPGGVSVSESDANRNKLRRNKHKQKVAAQNAYNKAGIDKLKGFALKKAKGRHTVAMKNAVDPLRTFRSKPLNAAAASSASAASSSSSKQVDF